jgi:uncharacterized protein YyaL (SSP411 family)
MPSSPHPHTNRLAGEPSPYLLQHAHNPVDWFPWGGEAFAAARAADKPIFLSIGYSTCHWCHVMERESFEDEAVAAVLREHFISIKVDREERPDVDKIYMTFVQSATGGGGWPLNVFLTPERKPFYGGTYFPPDNRHGRPSFRQLLQRIAELWQTQREQIIGSAASVQAQLESIAASANAPAAAGEPEAVLRAAGLAFKGSYDSEHGGFGGAPKFPQPSQPAFLLRYAKRFGDAEATRMVLHTCERMAAGGIHDQLGGGFARYSVDAQWLVPHFEKMLYDNAQLACLYLDAFLVSGDARYAEVARDILAYVQRDMTHPEGGFYSAEDADSEGQEGKFYCWTCAELSRLLSPEEFNVAVRYFGITEVGNFMDHSHPDPLPGLNVLSVSGPPVTGEDEFFLESATRILRAVRAGRFRPHRDDKILASWNGLMLSAFARAHAVLGDDSFRIVAERNLAFLQSKLWKAPTETGSVGTLYHRWRDGRRDDVQLLEAYAFLASGVLDLYEATLEARHLAFALALAEAMIAKLYDETMGGFWQSPAGAGDLIVRLKDEHDGAEPSGNSVAVLTLLRLAAITGRGDLRLPAEQTLRFCGTRLERLPQAVPMMLQALDFSEQEPLRVVITGDPASAKVHALLRAAQRVYQPNKVLLGAEAETTARFSAEAEAMAHVCSGQACQPPTSDPATLRRLLE